MVLIPEPDTLVMVGLAGAGLLASTLKRRRL
ncbi:MAG: PEP-CTERM sorting domain-containing protein [Verrucomicrobia bacterium]|nr:PEP-CTERM sorting domain-containing protein [Verrucomicrobiota bacterium]MCH8526967.1 PEP-CTERM sorting domain-containing protein [Kiritimatiellia bacterium]